MKPSKRWSLPFGDLQSMVAGHGLQSGLRFLAFIVWSQTLGPAGAGLIAAVQALTRLPGQFADFGIDTAFLSLGSQRYARGDQAGAAELCRSGFRMHLWIGAAQLLAGLIASPLIARYYFEDDTLTLPLMLAFAGTVADRFARFSTSVLRTFQRFTTYSVAVASAGIGLLVAVLALTLAERLSIVGIVALLMLGVPVMTSLVAVTGMPRGILSPGLPRRGAERVFRFGKWVYGSALAESGIRRINLLLVQGLAGNEAAGYFSAARQYVNALDALFEPLLKYLVPKFTALPDRRALQLALVRLYRWLGWSLLLVPAAWLLGGPVILGLQGEQWAPAVLVFQILFAARLAILLAKPLTYALFALEQPRFQMVLMTVLVLLFLAVGPPAIERWGIVGSALALLMVNLLALVGVALYAYQAVWREPVSR